MPSIFDETESRIAKSLKDNSRNSAAFRNELRDLKLCETSDAFKEDLSRLNGDLHKDGMLSGLQIVESEKTHEFELQNTYVKQSDLHKFWVVQPSKFECGSSAEAMAISKITRHAPFSAADIHELSKENGTIKQGLPHGDDNKHMENALKSHNLNAQTFDCEENPHQEMDQLDAELAKGRSAIAYIRNPDTGHGHFIFVAGKTDAKHYLIGNSGNPHYANAAPVDRETLQKWLLGKKLGHSYFVSVW